jgi:primosomal protein N' (replication factor Y) (superfamily II helicase)
MMAKVPTTMFVYVQLLNGFQKPLVYKLPQNLEDQNLLNKCVLVPLRQKKVSALVIAQTAKLKEKAAFEIKEVIGLKPFPNDSKFHSFIQKAAALYFTTPLHFYQKLRQFIKKTEQKKDGFDLHINFQANTPPSRLTDEQTTAANFINQSLTTDSFTPIVLHGVTGSGKTEVYKAAIATAIARGKAVLFLLPEVSMALQFKHRLQIGLESITILGFHSAASPQEKKAVWHALVKNNPIVIVGVHLPVLLPIANLGLIIIDEEHEAGFEEKKHPKLNSKYLAILRASFYKIPIVLGSATPSVQTIYHVQTKHWTLFKLTKRFAGAFPIVHTVILPKQTKGRFSFWISRELEKALKECLDNKKQAIIFLNRRGYSFFIQCRKCGFVAECPSCSVSLTSHQTASGELNLKCHYCNYTRNMPQMCSDCKADKSPFLTKGIGTQQLVEILQKMFPAAQIARADLDTTSKKNVWATTATAFEKGEIDILVGTKSITKGFHFPGVTLVGVVWGDLHAHIPLFNAAEQCLQQLIQVAGRAGREHPDSKVIIQTMHDHELFNFINEIDYLAFAQQELLVREETWYPPFCRLIQIELKHKNLIQVEKDAKTLTEYLQLHAASITNRVKVLGPAIPAIHKIQQIEVRHIFIKANQFSDVEHLLKQCLTIPLKSQVFIQFT